MGLFYSYICLMCLPFPNFQFDRSSRPEVFCKKRVLKNLYEREIDSFLTNAPIELARNGFR